MEVEQSSVRSKKIPRNVLFLGIVSFFNDVASEMIYPIVPIFLTSVLHASVPVVGLIEGIAEATASVSKWLFGSLSDYFQKRKPFVVTGYGFSAVSKLLLGLANLWPLVLLARFIDRIGKGIRTAPRDSLLLQNATKENRGFIFGFHRALDSLGAVVGPLLALLFLNYYQENIRSVFFVAFVPAVIGVFLLFLVKEKTYNNSSESHGSLRLAAARSGQAVGLTMTNTHERATLHWSTLPKQLKLFLVVSVLFALGNSSDAFLILRAKQLGLTLTLTILAYVLYNVFQTALATHAGKLADTIGPKIVYAIGLLVFAIVYACFAGIHNASFVWILFPIYGIYIAFTDGVSKAYISQFTTHGQSGSYFGMYLTVTAVGNFCASLVGGLLWSAVGPGATFLYGSILALLAFVIFILSCRNMKIEGRNVKQI